MEERAPRSRRWWAFALLGVVLVLGLATGVFWGDLVRTTLDPKVPFQTYRPPPAPDYAQRAAWALLPAHPDTVSASDPGADVFFVGPTVFDGGREWNAPIDDAKSDRLFRRVMAPNYAGPFVRVGRLFSPRYRQASLYSLMTLREDAREARKFAYADVQRAFHEYLGRYNMGRPFVVVGVEQGGTLAARLLVEEIAANPEIQARLAAAYLIETVVPADAPPLPPCAGRGQTGCLAAWASVQGGQMERAETLLDRALVWSPSGELENMGGRPALCFNPILGGVSTAAAPTRLHLGPPTPRDWSGAPGRPSWLVRWPRSAKAACCTSRSRNRARCVGTAAGPIAARSPATTSSTPTLRLMRRREWRPCGRAASNRSRRFWLMCHAARAGRESRRAWRPR